VTDNVIEKFMGAGIDRPQEIRFAEASVPNAKGTPGSKSGSKSCESSQTVHSPIPFNPSVLNDLKRDSEGESLL